MASRLSDVLKGAAWPAFGVSLLLLHLPAMFLTPFALLFLYAALVAGLGLARLLQVGRARSWPTVVGRVIESRVGEGGYVDQSEVGGHEFPEVVYEYEVQGRCHRGSLLGGDEYKTRSSWMVSRWLKRHAVGSSVTVHWNPEEPAQSLIVPRPILPWLVPLVGGSGFAAVVVAMFLEHGGPTRVDPRWNLLTLVVGAGYAAIAWRAQRRARS